MRTLAGGSRVWAIPWPCCYEFLTKVINHLGVEVMKVFQTV